MILAFFDFQDTIPPGTAARWANEAVVERYAERLRIPIEQSRAIISMVEIEARIQQVDPFLVLGLIKVESSGNPEAKSKKGAIGLMQVTPQTAKFIADKLGEKYKGKNSLLDKETNLRYGIWYLRYLRERYGNTETALAAYFWGPGNIDHRLRVGEQLPTQYTRKVLRAAYGY
jgi:soluble lytic murein transglycosylase